MYGQSELGQREAALASTQEAVTFRRKLSAQRPDSFLPDLASSLHNLAIDYCSFDRHGAALALAQEAFDIYWNLYQCCRPAFRADAANSARVLQSIHQALATLPDPETASRVAVILAE